MLKLSKQLGLAIGTGLLAATAIIVAIFVWRGLPELSPPSFPVAPKVLTVDDFLGEPIITTQRLIIDKLGINADIIPLGLDELGNFADPINPLEVGWYVGSPAFDSGDATASTLLDGHLTGPSGQPAIFANLHALAVGDELKIELAPGKTLTYEVTKLHNLAIEEIDLADYLTPTTPGKESLTIVTCAGDYDKETATYTKRLIVQAVLK